MFFFLPIFNWQSSRAYCAVTGQQEEEDGAVNHCHDAMLDERMDVKTEVIYTKRGGAFPHSLFDGGGDGGRPRRLLQAKKK